MPGPRSETPRPRRNNTDRPRSTKPRYGGDRPRSDRPPRENSDRPRYQGDRSRSDRPRYDSDRPRSDRPPRENSDRPRYQGDRSRPDRPRYDSDRSRSDRPRYDSDRPRSDRPPRENSDRPRFQGDRPKGLPRALRYSGRQSETANTQKVWRSTTPATDEAPRQPQEPFPLLSVEDANGKARASNKSERADDKPTFINHDFELPEEIVSDLGELPEIVYGQKSKESLASFQNQWSTQKVAERLAKASELYSRDRYQDALRILVKLKTKIKNFAPLDELHGLTLYRLGKWRPALDELEKMELNAGSTDQTPVIMDCYRALGRAKKVQELYEELRKQSPGPEVLAEAKIVLAKTLAEQGEIDRALEAMARSQKAIRNPHPYHVRQWYVLAELYENKGDLTRAAGFYRMVVDSGLDSYDAVDRLLEIT